MSTVKLSSGAYIIHTINSSDPIVLDAGNVIINGNLMITGATSTIETTNTVIYDNIITLNGGVTGTPTLNAGISIQRGTSANVSLQWSEPMHRWQLTTDGILFANILSSQGSGAGLSSVIDDLTPTLGGNLNLNSYAISSNVGNMKLQGNVQLNNTLVIPSSTVTNATVVYSAPPAAGSTGLYVLNNASTNEELITKRRALGFSILF